jgi:glyoxylase-like metal-dependent hydrolase (beta-lactamase superfamily II)
MVDRQTGKIALIDPARLGRYESVTYGVGMVHAFANAGLIQGKRSAIVIDTSSSIGATQTMLAIRSHCDLPLKAIIYTHGHLDHVTGVQAFLDDSRERGEPRPEIWGHERVLARFDRYERLQGWIEHVNQRQFAQQALLGSAQLTLVRPDHTYTDFARLDLDGEPVELHHASAETDDATWVWLPERQVAFIGDLLLYSLPNTGNPNKVQRDTLGWAEALERIAAKEPRFVIPGHLGALPAEVSHEMLRETARALRYLHDAVVDRLNAGLWPDEIVAEQIRLPADLAAKPYLNERYGCCDFVVRDVLRQYAGWWGGSPADLTPSSRRERAADWLEMVEPDRVRDRVRQLLSAGASRRAMPFAVMLADAPQATESDRAQLAEVLEAVAEQEPSYIVRSLMKQEAALARNPVPPETRRKVTPTPTTNGSASAKTRILTAKDARMKDHAAPAAGDWRPHRIPLMRLINFFGRIGRAVGLGRPLSSEAILRSARRRTRLQNFGDDRFLDGLDRLCEAFNRTARLEPFGALLVKETLVRLAANRLTIEDWYARHPEIADSPIRKPLFVLGLPRTGTTLLYNLLAQDPHARPLMTWETLFPAPDPLLHGGTSDPRRVQTRRGIRLIQRIAPQMQQIHHVDPDGPEECTWLLNNTFMSPGFSMDGHVPDYLDWLVRRTDDELIPAYRDYRRQLQLVAWGSPEDKHWLNKSPLHLNGIGAMLQVFPDGCFVQTHRDPAAVIPSTCSLVAVMRGRCTAAIDPKQLGPVIAPKLSAGLTKAMAARERAPERMFDVRYPDLVQDPLGTVAKVYEHFGYDLSPEMQSRMERWLREHAQNKHGAHKYSLEDFGLNPERIDELFGEYARTVGVAKP